MNHLFLPIPESSENSLRPRNQLMGNFTAKGLPPIVLCSANTRIHLRKIMERFFPNIVVLAHNEITADTNITSLGMVEV